MDKEKDTFYSQSAKRRILVVEDQQLNREILKNILDTDYEVILASDGEQANVMLQKPSGDLPAAAA